jgi:Concanavalin A-like lectin/glucanases superfamily
MRINVMAMAVFMTVALSSSASVTVQAWYHLGETGTLPGGLPLDSSGNGNHMNDGFSEFESVHASPNTPGGPLGRSGWISTNSSEWGRGGDVIIAARDGYYVSGDNFGIEAWVLPSGNGYNVFCCEGSHNFTAQIFASGADSTGFYLGVKNNQDGTYSFVAAVVTDTNGVAQVGDALPLITNAWTHLAVVRNNGTNTFYANGVPNGASTFDTPSTNVPTGTGSQNGMRLGASGGDQVAYRGLIDEARAFTFNPGQFSITNLLYPSASTATPLIVSQPANATVWDGGAVPFTVTAASSPSLTYQWKRNGVNLPGATTSSLFLPNISRPADNGSLYNCLVSNTTSHASTLSSNATLSVTFVQTNNTAIYHNLVTGQASLVGYFPVDNNTGTSLSNVKYPAQPATLEGNATYEGRTDRAFGQRALALNRDADLGDATLANNPAYSFPDGIGTIEAMVYMGENGVYINSGGWTYPTIFAIGEADRTLLTTLIGVSKTGDALECSADGGLTILSWPVPSNLTGRFAHVAFTFDQASGITAYADGRSLGTQGAFSPAASTSPGWIGSEGSYTNSFTGATWSGTIDELAIYTNALSATTINAHYSMFVYGTNTAPVILSAPSPVAIFAGAAINTASFAVNAEGSLPLSFQWKSNGVVIPGATSTSYTVSNITASSSATYSVSVSNPIDATNVSATLTVLAPTGYAGTVISDNPMAYWRLGERAGPTALDSWGANNGSYFGTETFGLPGAIAGDSDTSVDFSGNGASLVRIPYSSDLNGGPDPNGSWTVECWVWPDLDAATEGGLFAVPVASVDLLANRSGYFFLEQPDGWQLRLGNTSGYLSGWNGAAGSFGGVPQANTWYHLVGQYDGAAGNGYAYVNGVQVKSAPVVGLAQNMTATFNIGDRGDGAPFAGRVDEVAVYSGVLSASRIQAHYYAARPPKINLARSGANLILTWPIGVLYQANSVNGPYTIVSGASSPYQTTPNQAAKFYLLRTQ